MKKLLGVFDVKKTTPEQIYDEVVKTIQERDRLALLKMAKSMGKKKK